MASHRISGNRHRFGKVRRTLTVSITAVVTLALAAAYVVGDAFDLVPGYLTFSEQTLHSVSIDAPLAAVAPQSSVGDVDLTKSIDTKAATRLVKDFIKAEGVGSHVSVIVADGTGKEVVSSKATTPREPASTLKTLTAFAATENLDMRSTLDTQVYVTEHDGSKATIVLRGNGDMMLGAGASDSAHVNGRAGLQTLAEKAASALKKQGITSISLEYDDSMLGTKRVPDNMDDDMISSGNFTPVASMAVDEGKQWGKNEKPSNPDAMLGWLPTRTTSPARQAASTFAQKLKKSGMKVTGDIGSTTLSSSVLKDSQARVAAVKSAQLWELLRFTLQQSDNTYAELFGRLVALRTGAQNSPEGAVSAVLKSLKDNGVSTKGLHLSDCSGLSDKSKLTASALIQVQEKYMSSLDASALEGMGVSGFSGTALERAFTPKVRGLIRLKTGSLSEVTSMTGNVVRTKGGVVFFAVIVNKPENMWSAHVAVDSFVSKLADL
ncbi:MAG: D-alanyl-D-alanine carboxypeptidase [Bifidobacteriaceae bacterium]|nr:D-alanyl-D-alanine carboxypeptidase [Bifidobacteriaceae bacterium]